MLSVLMCELFLLPSSIHSLKSLNNSVSVVLSKLNEGWNEGNRLDFCSFIVWNCSIVRFENGEQKDLLGSMEKISKLWGVLKIFLEKHWKLSTLQR